MLLSVMNLFNATVQGIKVHVLSYTELKFPQTIFKKEKTGKKLPHRRLQ